MIESHAAAALLDECRTVVIDGLIPLLPADRRYDARMIANALARVSRQITGSRRAATEEIEALERLADDDSSGPAVRVLPTDAGGSLDRRLEERLHAARRRLCAAIRAGRFDARLDNPGDLLRLRETVHAKLRITNPRLLADES